MSQIEVFLKFTNNVPKCCKCFFTNLYEYIVVNGFTEDFTSG